MRSFFGCILICRLAFFWDEISKGQPDCIINENYLIVSIYSSLQHRAVSLTCNFMCNLVMESSQILNIIGLQIYGKKSFLW